MQVPHGVHHQTVCKQAQSDRCDMTHKPASACLFMDHILAPADRWTRLLVSADAAAQLLDIPFCEADIGNTRWRNTTRLHAWKRAAIVCGRPACRIDNIPCRITGAARGLERHHGRIIEVAAWVQDSMSRTSLTHLPVARSHCCAILRCAPTLPSVRLA